MSISLVTILMLSNNIYYTVCQVGSPTFDVYEESLLQMNERVEEAYLNLKNNDKDSIASEAEKVIQFSVEIVLKNFPEFSQNSETFMQIISEVLEASFRIVNDDLLVQINADSVVLDDIEKILREQKQNMVADLVSAIVLPDAFIKQVMIALEYGFMENYYIDTYQYDYNQE